MTFCVRSVLKNSSSLLLFELVGDVETSLNLGSFTLDLWVERPWVFASKAVDDLFL